MRLELRFQSPEASAGGEVDPSKGKEQVASRKEQGKSQGGPKRHAVPAAEKPEGKTKLKGADPGIEPERERCGRPGGKDLGELQEA